MAKKSKLSEDELKWILSVDSTDAQQNIHKLNNSSKELATENRKLQKSMTDLVAAGKKESDEYRNLETVVKANNKTISENKIKVDALEKSMGLSALTMTQLRKRAKDLQHQLDNTAEALHPQEYAGLTAELNRVKDRMTELKKQGQDTQESFGSVIRKNGAIATFVGNIWIKALEWGKQFLDQAKEFVSGGEEMAASLEGIQHAFDRFATRDDLKKLRQDTKGLVSDFELIKASVRAENFDIPLGQLGKLLQFANQRAKDTGQSVDYMVNSIVDGIGRKSVLILDNLGISAAKVNAEVKKGGDFASAVAKIVEEEMEKVGEAIDTAADTATRKAVALENWQLTIGQRTFKVRESWDKMTTSLIESLNKLMAVEKSQKDEYQDQIKKVADLEVNTASLARRYEELKGKTTLSKDETVELNRVINSLRSAVPGIATEFDKYGNVISINTQKVYDFIEAEKAKLSVMNKTAIEEQTKNLKQYEKELEKVNSLLKTRQKIVMTPGSTFTQGNSVNVALTDEEVKAAEERKSKLQSLITGTEAWIEDMNGTSIENQVKTQRESLEKRNEFNTMTKKQLDEYIKINKEANDKYVELASEVYNYRFGSGEEDQSVKKADVNTKLKDFDNEHAQELALLKKYKLENQEEEEVYQAKVLESNIKYYDARIKLLKQFVSKTSDKSLKVDYQKQIIDAESKSLEAEQQLNDSSLARLKKTRDEKLKIEEDAAKIQNAVLAKALANREITQEQHDALMLESNAATSEERLRILREYQSEVEELEKISGSMRAKAIEEANTAVLDADLKAAQARAAQQKQLQNLLKDFKDEFKLTTVGEDSDLQLKALEASYQARKEMAEKAGMDTVDLDAAYEKAKTNILQEAEDERNKIRQQYGLLTLQEQHQLELDQLAKYRDEGLITEEEYQKALLNKRIEGMKAYFDYYKNLVSGAVNALQEAELSNLDAKYDAEIARAQGNAEEVSRLEKEKEQKKLDIQKKYAGAQFAIKVSEILANTAVSIMKAFADLGPIGGAIAAALMTVTGAAQIAVANAERKKVMSMTVDGGSSGASSTGRRVVTGREKGGRLNVIRAQDGKEFDAIVDPDKRGFVDRPTVIVGEGPSGRSKEWVASNDALENPTVAPIIDLFNDAQEKGVIRTVDMNQLMRKRLAGFDSGGFISRAASVQSSTAASNTPAGSQGAENADIKKLNELLQEIKRTGLPAYVLLEDLNRAQDLSNKARNIGSK